MFYGWEYVVRMHYTQYDESEIQNYLLPYGSLGPIKETEHW